MGEPARLQVVMIAGWRGMFQRRPFGAGRPPVYAIPRGEPRERRAPAAPAPAQRPPRPPRRRQEVLAR